MMKSKKIVLLLAAMGLLVLSGCQTTGKCIQGVGGVINKTGGVVRNLG